MIMARPFLKWAGGKRQLMKQLEKLFPKELKDGEEIRYAEPFVGGGAMLFELLGNDKYNISEVFISDTNGPLIMTYTAIKEQLDGVKKHLKNYQKQYDKWNNDPNSYERRREWYFALRDEKFWELTKTRKDTKNIEDKDCQLAALVILFNKLGFNGIYRMNRDGKFNVPPSNLVNKTFYNENELIKVHDALQKVREIENGDYQSCRDFVMEQCQSTTFVYFDPPYLPLKPTSFTSYSNSERDFSTESAHIQLAKFAIKLPDGRKNVKIMISNSDINLTINKDGMHEYKEKDGKGYNDFFEKNFPNFKIHQVLARRSINRNGSGRGKIRELVIVNYPID
jgi:DNA adenine methylase